jgi:hypothetical protein
VVLATIIRNRLDASKYARFGTPVSAMTWLASFG